MSVSKETDNHRLEPATSLYGVFQTELLGQQEAPLAITNGKAKSVIAPFLEVNEHIMWADVPDETRSWTSIIAGLWFQVFWLGFVLYFIVGSIADGVEEATTVGGLMFCFGLFWTRSVLLEKLAKRNQYYALTNQRGIIVESFKMNRFSFLKLEHDGSKTLTRATLRTIKVSGNAEKATLFFRGRSPIDFGDIPTTSPLRKLGSYEDYEFRNIRNPDFVKDLIQLHFFGAQLET